MSKSTTIQHAQLFSHERGSHVPASMIKSASTATSATIGIDLSQATPPDRCYPAELADVVYENGVVKLMFGQATRNGKVRSLIEVSMSPLAVIQALKVIDTINNPTLEELVKVTGDEGRKLSSFDEDPPEVARLKANMMSIGFALSETSIDFFDTSPYTMRNLQKGATTATVLGVVRVDTQSSLFYALVLKMKELALQFPTQVRALTEAKK